MAALFHACVKVISITVITFFFHIRNYPPGICIALHLWLAMAEARREYDFPRSVRAGKENGRALVRMELDLREGWIIEAILIDYRTTADGSRWMARERWQRFTFSTRIPKTRRNVRRTWVASRKPRLAMQCTRSPGEFYGIVEGASSAATRSPAAPMSDIDCPRVGRWLKPTGGFLW